MGTEGLVITIIGHFISLTSEEIKYDNMKEDLSNCILFTTNTMTKAKEEFKKIIIREKTKSWVADILKYNVLNTNNGRLYYYEDDEEFVVEDRYTGRISHIQIVKHLMN